MNFSPVPETNLVNFMLPKNNSSLKSSQFQDKFMVNHSKNGNMIKNLSKIPIKFLTWWNVLLMEELQTLLSHKPFIKNSHESKFLKFISKWFVWSVKRSVKDSDNKLIQTKILILKVINISEQLSDHYKFMILKLTFWNKEDFLNHGDVQIKFSSNILKAKNLKIKSMRKRLLPMKSVMKKLLRLLV